MTLNLAHAIYFSTQIQMAFQVIQFAEKLITIFESVPRKFEIEIAQLFFGAVTNKSFVCIAKIS